MRDAARRACERGVARPGRTALVVAFLGLWPVVGRAADPATEQARADAAIRVLQQVRVAHAGGQATAEDVYRWSLRVLEAERATGRASAAPDHHRRMQALQGTVRELAASGLVSALEADAAAFYVAEAKALLHVGSAHAAVDPLDPMFVPPPPAPALLTSAGDTPTIEACFARCEAEQETCTTAAEHFRLGVGGLDPGDAECNQTTEEKCGTARNQAATACRDQTNRACQAERRAASCALGQTQCSARCR